MEVPIIISDENNKSEISSRKKLKNRLTTGTFALLIALLAVVSATYAWYVYNTGRHTTKVRMAAGAGVNLQISNSYSGTYGSAAVLDSFSGSLNPVSTNRISGGFQKVLGFTNGTENQSNLVASLFGRGDYTDYYKTSLFLRTNGNPTDIYIADIYRVLRAMMAWIIMKTQRVHTSFLRDISRCWQKQGMMDRRNRLLCRIRK
ncbi:hypothetical protein [Blautia sp.]|jgi:hypothetical protein|uniref:hypothetical protein n=1 Tax=Blautia sp. TaxID=1955243 RepID=UPI003AB7D8B4